MATNGDIVEGYLVVKVLEVAGHNKNDEPVWDPSFQAGYVKGESISSCLWLEGVTDGP